MLQQKNRNLIVNSVVIKGNKQKINKMKRFSKHIFIFMFLIISALISSAQISDDIITCFKTGNSAKLSSFFNDNIELVVLENENVLSKSHAQQIVNEFFKKNTPQKFSIIHKGGKGDSNYAIGTLETQNGKFRIYFLLKTVNQVSFIHQLRIEKQNE